MGKQKKWSDISAADKAMLVIRIVASVGVVIFASLQLFGIWVQSINLTAPLMGVVLLLQSIQEWKTHRGIAIFGLCAAVFIFVCAIVVWFIR